MFPDSVCLKVERMTSFRMRRYSRLWHHEYDVTVTSNRRAVGTFVYAPYWTRTSELFRFRDISIKVADEQTHVD